MRLSVRTDALGNKQYILENNGAQQIIGEALARLRITHGEIDNAVINELGEIVVQEEKPAKQTFISMTDNGGFTLIALAYREAQIAFYIVCDAKGEKKKMAPSVITNLAATGLIKNVRVENDINGVTLKGIGFDIKSLPAIYLESEKPNKNIKAANLVISAEAVRAEADMLSASLTVDKRNKIGISTRYPRTSLLKNGKLKIKVSGRDYDVELVNIDKIITDEESTSVIRVSSTAGTTQGECAGLGYIETNVYMIAISAYLILLHSDSTLQLEEIKLANADGQWLAYLTKQEQTDDKIVEINNSHLQTIRSMYAMSLSKDSAQLDDEALDRIIRCLKIGKARITCNCESTQYVSTEFTLIERENTIRIGLKSTEGDEVIAYYTRLTREKKNIKNIIVLCAAALANRDVINTISVEILQTDMWLSIDFVKKF